MTTYEFGGGVQGDCVDVTLTNGTSGTNVLSGMVAQSVSGTVQKSPAPIYEIGSNYYYIVESRPSGSGQITHLIGPNSAPMWSALQGFADVCQETTLSIGMRSGCNCKGSGETGGLKFTGGFLSSISVSAQAASYVINSELGFTFFDVSN